MYRAIIFPFGPTLNDIIKTARGSKGASLASKDGWDQKCLQSLKFQQVNCKFPGRVWLAALFRAPNLLKRDPVDNLTVALKSPLDALQMHGTIKNDSAIVIQEPFISYWEDSGDLSPEILLLIADHPLIHQHLPREWLDMPSFHGLVNGAERYEKANTTNSKTDSRKKH